MLAHQRQEAEAIGTRDALDGDTPIGSALGDRGGNGVVRTWLVPVAGRAGPVQKPVDEEARPRTGVAAHHDGVRVEEERRDDTRRVAFREPAVAGVEHQSLHPRPALGEAQRWGQEGRIVAAGRGIEEMHRGDLALAPLQGGEPS